MAIALTIKAPLSVNAILGILEMGLIVLTLMNACLIHVMLMLIVRTPKGLLCVNVIMVFLGMASIVLT